MVLAHLEAALVLQSGLAFIILNETTLRAILLVLLPGSLLVVGAWFGVTLLHTEAFLQISNKLSIICLKFHLVLV